mmetsp:Transcript_75828/g.165400  ORF Transcript_75828/g.165400 Transcript_75828/m.165400 type:complete len:322 (-) Transcript_75828:577-1542(-)
MLQSPNLSPPRAAVIRPREGGPADGGSSEKRARGDQSEGKISVLCFKHSQYTGQRYVHAHEPCHDRAEGEAQRRDAHVQVQPNDSISLQTDVDRGQLLRTRDLVRQVADLAACNCEVPQACIQDHGRVVPQGNDLLLGLAAVALGAQDEAMQLQWFLSYALDGCCDFCGPRIEIVEATFQWRQEVNQSFQPLCIICRLVQDSVSQMLQQNGALGVLVGDALQHSLQYKQLKGQLVPAPLRDFAGNFPSRQLRDFPTCIEKHCPVRENGHLVGPQEQKQHPAPGQKARRMAEEVVTAHTNSDADLHEVPQTCSRSLREVGPT